jgi:hypothetical protein
MRPSLLPAILSSLALFACSQEVPLGGADAASEPPDAAAAPGLDASEPDDAASTQPDADSAPPDASGPQQVIAVHCAGPASPVRANTRVDIDCTVDTRRPPVSAPALSASPSAGVVLQQGSSSLQMASASPPPATSTRWTSPTRPTP